MCLEVTVLQGFLHPQTWAVSKPPVMSFWEGRGDGRCALPALRAGKKVTWPSNPETAVLGGGNQRPSVTAQKGGRYSTRPPGCHLGFWGGMWENAGAVRTLVMFRKQECPVAAFVTDRQRKKTDLQQHIPGMAPAFQSSFCCFLCCLKCKGCFCVLSLAESGVSLPHKQRPGDYWCGSVKTLTALPEPGHSS